MRWRGNLGCLLRGFVRWRAESSAFATRVRDSAQKEPYLLQNQKPLQTRSRFKPAACLNTEHD
jgi:hypothetical protein